MKPIRTLAVLNFIFFLLNIGASALTQVKAFNNKDVAEVSRLYPSLFTPANFTFSIWGLIYFSLFAFCIYHIVIAFTKTALHPANNNIEKSALYSL